MENHNDLIKYNEVESDMESEVNEEKYEEEKEIVALIKWLKSFPQLKELREDTEDLEQDERLIEWLECEHVARAILGVTKEIYGNSISGRTHNFSNNEGSLQLVWEKILNMTATEHYPQNNQHCNDPTLDLCLAVLSTLLCRAVSDKCPLRHDYVNRIMTLPSPTQRALMFIIENNMNSSAPHSPSTPTVSPSPKKRPPPSPPRTQFYTPKQYKTRVEHYLSERSQQYSPIISTPSDQIIPTSLFSSPISSYEQITDLQKQIESLQDQNTKLSQKLSASQSNENQLFIQLEDAKANHRSQLLQLENESLHRMSDLKNKHSTEMVALQHQIQELLFQEEENERHKDEISKLKAELELSKELQRKLSRTENQYEKCKNKLNALLDIEQQLKREEEAHAKCVEQCFAYEKKLHSFGNVKQQMEEYKSRAVDAEEKLGKVEDELKRSKRQITQLREDIKEIEESNRAMKHDIEIKMEEECLEDEDIYERIGAERNEMSPEFKENLLRLQYQLANYANCVETMEKVLDDMQSLCANNEEQLLSTKQKLEDTQQLLNNTRVELQLSKKQEESLQCKLRKEKEMKADYMERYLDATSTLKQAQQSLEESVFREEELKKDVQDMMQRHAYLVQEMTETQQARETSLHDIPTKSLEQLCRKDMEEEMRVCRNGIGESAKYLYASLNELLKTVEHQPKSNLSN